MKKILFLLFFPFTIFSQQITYNKYTIDKIATISIPNNMESEPYYTKKIKENFLRMDYSSQKVVFLPKGDTEYARIIVWKHRTSAKNVSVENMKNEEMNTIEEEFKSSIRTAKIVRWAPIKKVKIGTNYALLINYEREAVNRLTNYNVIVKEYLFFNEDNIIRLTTSYQKTRAIYWSPIYSKIINSFSLIK